MTDDQARNVQQYEYDSFGNQHDMKNRIKQPYGYTGREHDRETGLRYYRARYYDGEVGRFISEDPIGFAGGDVNLSNYVLNNPISFVDPTGLAYDSVTRAYLTAIARGNIPEAVAIAQAATVGHADKLARYINQLRTIMNRYPRSSMQCDTLSKKLVEFFNSTGGKVSVNSNPQIMNITDKFGARYFFDSKGAKFAESGFHQAVRVGDRVFDAITGPNGMSYNQYISTLESYGIAPVVNYVK
jgi:RHS repeat-associated protein